MGNFNGAINGILMGVYAVVSDSDVIFCLKLLSKTLICILHLS